MNKDYVVSSLQKQKSLLNDLITMLQTKSILGSTDLLFYDQVTKRIESDLRKLRKEGAACMVQQAEVKEMIKEGH